MAQSRLTAILSNFENLDQAQFDELLAAVYDELHALAVGQMQKERAGHTLQPTALVHEAYLRLIDAEHMGWEGRAHFFGIAARAMRQVLVDHARQRGAEKRGGGLKRVTVDTGIASADPRTLDLVALHQALERLEEKDEQLAKLVELRFFTGLTLDETADALKVSRRKAAKDWAAVRLWLADQLSDDTQL